ncbi:MAG: DUF3344 domain-containing protein [Promethearchaeia archaeon]
MKTKSRFLILVIMILIFSHILSILSIENELLMNDEGKVRVSTPYTSEYNFDGYILRTMTNGSVKGGIYASQGSYSGGTTSGTSYYDIPNGTIKWARLYVGIWGGSPDSVGEFDASINGNDLGRIEINGEEDSNPTYSNGTNVYGSGYGAWWVSYNVTSYINPGVQNNASASKVSGDLDGRMYCIFLIVVYEDSSMPLIDYWINEGAVSLNYQGLDDTKTYFYGAIDKNDIEYAEFTAIYITGTSGEEDYLYFNHEIDDKGENQLGGNDVAKGDDGFGFDYEVFNVTSLLISSDNYVKYFRGDESFIRPTCAILTLKHKEEDINPPTIDNPEDIVYEAGTVGNKIIWTPNDPNPSYYVITRNDTGIVEQGPWDGSIITINIDGLTLGSYNYTCYVNDTSGNSANDSVIVTVIDTTAPYIDAPLDVFYQKGTTGNTIIWHPSDQYPANYIVTKDGQLYEKGIWNGSDIIIDIDGLDVGIYYFNCYVNDTSGNSNNDTVMVNVTENIHINHPEDISYIEGELNHKIIWKPSSLNPDSYIIYKNKKILSMGPWNGSNIEVNVDNLEVNVYNYTCWVNDTNGNYIQDTVFVSVIYDSFPPAILGSENYNYEYGSVGNIIRWNVSDINPYHYNITRNGMLIESRSWNGSDIIINIDGLNLGFYTYTCIVKDKNNNTSNDEVNITVVDTTIPYISANVQKKEIESGSSVNVSWFVSDLLPLNYTIIIDGKSEKSKSWKSNENISIEFYGFDLGLHFLKCIINDTSGNENSNTVTIYVKDTTPPTLKNKVNFNEFKEGTKENLIWIAEDLHPGEYYIYCNGLLLKNGIWENNHELKVSLTMFSEGIYNFTCKVFDTSNNSITDSLIINIVKEEGSENHEILSPVLIGSIFGVSSITCTFIMIAVRKSKRRRIKDFN